MDIFLMRHADAMDSAGDDFARLLSKKGRGQADAMGRWLRKVKTALSAIVTSPYPRAHETAYIVSHLVNPTRLITDRRMASGMTVETGCAIIYEFSSREGPLLLVGHAPDLDRLTAYLIGAGEENIRLVKGAVAQLEMVRVGFGGSLLKRLTDPQSV